MSVKALLQLGERAEMIINTLTARFGYRITRNAKKAVKLSFFIGLQCANFWKNQNQRIVFIMTDRDIKTIELIINNEQAKKRLDEL